MARDEIEGSLAAVALLEIKFPSVHSLFVMVTIFGHAAAVMHMPWVDGTELLGGDAMTIKIVITLIGVILTLRLSPQ